MHILLRGDIWQRLRLASGLVLFLFAATHLLNHAVGLISFEYMTAVQFWRKLITRSLTGSLILWSAFAIHIALGLARIAGRKTLRMPAWEATQVVTGVLVPLLLIPHVVFNRGANLLAGTVDTYAYELANTWPEHAWQQTALILIMWLHATIGLHHWLRIGAWYRYARLPLFALAVALPVAAIAGFTVAGRHVAKVLAAPDAYKHLQSAALAPKGETVRTLERIDSWGRFGFLALVIAAGAVPLTRRLRAHRGGEITITYRGGPSVRTEPGPTLLEISRAGGVPHASVCGGRARCSTCRVDVGAGRGTLPPPGPAEAATLAAIAAPPRVRLACQIRPSADLTVTRLVPAKPPLRDPVRGAPEAAGIEQTMAVMFLDARGFTALADRRLPYDVVFILNRLFGEVGAAILANGGRIDKYMGDGLLALFAPTSTPDDFGEACRRALKAAQDVDLALERLNTELAGELGQPLRIGMGIEVGSLVVGEIGHPDSAALTVIGTAVNTASRLEALTRDKSCQLVVSAEVMRLAGQDTGGFAHERVAIRGLSGPREIVIVPRGRDLASDALRPARQPVVS